MSEEIEQLFEELKLMATLLGYDVKDRKRSNSYTMYAIDSKNGKDEIGHMVEYFIELKEFTVWKRYAPTDINDGDLQKVRDAFAKIL